jgi:hypothetical protein
MAQRKQSAGARKRRSNKAANEFAYAGEKPVREAGRMASAGAQAAEDMTRRTADVVQSNGEAAANGMQEASLLWSELAQDALRQNVETAQNLMRCRTLGELIEVQTDWMRRSLDNFVGRGTRISELSARLALDAVTRFGGAAEANADRARRAGERLGR